MSTRRSLFTFGALLVAFALLVPMTAFAQLGDPRDVKIESVDSPTQLKVTWEEPMNTTGVSGYRVYYRHTIAVDATSLTNTKSVNVSGVSADEATLTGLEPGTLYFAGVASLDENGDVDSSITASMDADGPMSAMTDDAANPAPPTNVKAKGGDGTFTVTWDTPYAGSGLEITHYLVRKRTVVVGDAGDWVPDVDGKMFMASPAVFEDLMNDVTYQAEVRAVNNADNMSDWSDPAMATTDKDATDEAPALPLVGLGFLGAMLAGRGAWLRRRNA